MKKSFYIVSSIVFFLVSVSALLANSQSQPDPVYLRPNFTNTGRMCSLILRLDSRVRDGYEFGVYSSLDSLVGSGVAYGSNCVITVWGDNVQTPDVVDGAIPGEKLTIRAFDTLPKLFHDVTLSEIKDGTGGSDLAELIYVEGYITANLFIPFLPAEETTNSRTFVAPSVSTGTFRLVSNSQFNQNVRVANALGNIVREFTSNGPESEIDLAGEPCGTYFIIVSSEASVNSFKIVLQK